MTTARRLPRRTLLALTSVVALAGCAAAPDPDQPQRLDPSAPENGRSLRDLGLRHGPTGFALPEQVEPLTITDSPNVVTFTFAVEDGPGVQSFLQDNARAMGLTGVRSVSGSMTFRIGEWDGGFTSSRTLVGLTLRKVR